MIGEDCVGAFGNHQQVKMSTYSVHNPSRYLNLHLYTNLDLQSSKVLTKLPSISSDLYKVSQLQNFTDKSLYESLCEGITVSAK